MSTASPPAPSRPLRDLAGWAVHALTAIGAVLAFLSVLAVEQHDFRLALIWLGAALILDGIDGPLARWADVARRLPEIDGSTLDLVVDYLNYVFVPAILIYRMDLLPRLLAIAGVAAILLSSLFTFARTDMKTEDNFFRGFPAIWNVVAFYLFVLRPDQVTSAVIVGTLSVSTFAPVLFVHPLRVRIYRPWLGIATGLWAFASFALLLPDWGAQWTRLWIALSLIGAGMLLAISAVRTARQKTDR